MLNVEVTLESRECGRILGSWGAGSWQGCCGPACSGVRGK